MERMVDSKLTHLIWLWPLNCTESYDSLFDGQFTVTGSENYLVHPFPQCRSQQHVTGKATRSDSVR